MRIKWELFFAGIFGLRAGLAIYFLGEKLTPDSAEFSHGKGGWSSLLAAGMGSIGGSTAVKIWGITGAIALGFIAGKWGKKAGFLIFFLPPGLYTMQPSADAWGAASVGLLYTKLRRNPTVREAIPIASFHLESYLVVCFSRVLERCGIRSRYIGLVGGGIACIGEWHFQARYFLPGLVIACCPILPRLAFSKVTAFYLLSESRFTRLLIRCFR